MPTEPTPAEPAPMPKDDRLNLEYHLETLERAIIRLERCNGMVRDYDAPWRRALNRTRTQAHKAQSLLSAALEADRDLLNKQRGWG